LLVRAVNRQHLLRDCYSFCILAALAVRLGKAQEGGNVESTQMFPLAEDPVVIEIRKKLGVAV
jgi:hypothetical protein